MFMLIDNYHNEEQTNDRAAIHNLLHINNHNLRSVCVVHNKKIKLYSVASNSWSYRHI